MTMNLWELFYNNKKKTNFQKKINKIFRKYFIEN